MDTELMSTKDIQPLPVEEPPQNSDICQLIRKECCIEAREEQEVKNVVEQSAERRSRSIQSLQNFRVVHKSSISYNTSQISSIHAIASVLSTKEPEHLLSMGYEHLIITPETESDEVTESNAENLLPIPSECEVAFEDKKECDLPIYENSPICNDNSDTFSDSKIDDDISVYDDDFEDIDIDEENSVEEENVVQQEEEEVNFEDISQIQDVVLHEKVLSITHLISNIESLNDHPTLDHERLINLMKNDISNSSNDPLLEEVDLFLSDNSIPPGIENFADDPEGDIRFLLLIDDSILSHELSNSNFKNNPSIPRPPPKPPDVETDAGEKIPVVMNDKDEDVDYSSFIFVIYPEMFPLLLFAECKDTIFDLGFFPEIEVFLCWIFVRFQDLHIL
nr:hypothetical protein [Tanacetum cinerariifolium]